MCKADDHQLSKWWEHRGKFMGGIVAMIAALVAIFNGLAPWFAAPRLPERDPEVIRVEKQTVDGFIEEFATD